MSEMVTVIVPVYNCEKSLNRCVDSLLNQTYKELEIILINDGSKDNSLNICRKYEAENKNITVVDQENQGVSAARNAGIRKSTAKYLTFVDSDDYLRKDYINSMMLKMYEGIDLVIAGHQSVDESGHILGSSNVVEEIYEKKNFPKLVIELLEAGNMNQPYGKIFRKNKIIHNFDENVTLGEDLLFVENYLLECQRVSLCGSDDYMYVCMNEGSLTNKYYEDGIEIFKHLYNESLHFSKALLSANYYVNQMFAEKYLSNLLIYSEMSVCSKSGNARKNKLVNVSQIIKEDRLEFKNAQLLSKKRRYSCYLKMELYFLFIMEISIKKYVRKFLSKLQRERRKFAYQA